MIALLRLTDWDSAGPVGLSAARLAIVGGQQMDFHSVEVDSPKMNMGPTKRLSFLPKAWNSGGPQTVLRGFDCLGIIFLNECVS